MKTLTRASPYVIAVDNEPDLLLLFKSCLSSVGFEVGTSLNAKDLWEMLLKKKPDIIFLDIHMDGVDGGKICHNLKKNKETADIPVIILSANEDIESIAVKSCANGFIKKPFKTRKIVALINRMVIKVNTKANILFSMALASLCQ
jgi:two-component system alkaline phosphatase synthesis response regulator PhoP